jgi:Crinkler effector protein N-terminal domain
MSDPEIEILCWILGDEPRRRFSVQISLEAYVAKLKDAIKENQRPAFDLIDATTLILYKISVADDDLDTKLKNIDPDSLKNEHQWRDKLSEVYSDPLTDIIIVKLPDGECK